MDLTKRKISRLRICLCGLLAFALTPAFLKGQDYPEDSATGLFRTPVTESDIDPATFAEAVGGHETSLAGDQAGRRLKPQLALWTQTSTSSLNGILFGDSTGPGTRYLRIGFTRDIPIGAILAMGDVSVSVLKTGVVYPGNMADDSQWLQAERIEDGRATEAALKDQNDCAIWVLPPGTKTQAIRFSHTSQASDNVYGGRLTGAYVQTDRIVNIAPEARTATRSANDASALLNNEKLNGFSEMWANIPVHEGDRPHVMADDPEWVSLTWTTDVSVSGVALLFAGFGSAEIQVYNGLETSDPRHATDDQWKTIKTIAGLKNLYPTSLGVHWIDFGGAITTRGLRLRITAVSDESHPHMKGNTRDGKRVWLGQLLALHELGDGDLSGAIPPVETKPEMSHAPIPVHFALPEDGLVTLVIEDEKGNRIRNLVSETPFSKGANTVWWDATDDLSRDADAARHGLYHIPARPVPPGTYRVRGLWHKEIIPRYEFSIYTEGNPPWDTPTHTGAWMANHTPPQAAVFVPADHSPTGEPTVFLGSYVTEGPDGLIWVDLDGRKRGGERWIGGLWSAAPFLARDGGPNAIPGVCTYVASSVETGDKPSRPELRVTAITLPDNKPGSQHVIDKPVLKEVLDGEATLTNGKTLGGMAAYNGVIVLSLTPRDQLLFIDAKQGKILGYAPMKSPRGLAFDSEGHLFALSGHNLVRVEKADNPDQISSPETIVGSGLEDPVALTFDASGDIYVSDGGTSHQVKIFNPRGQLLRAIGRAGTPKAGPYDPLHMNNPAGLAIDSKQQLWVAENDFLPKRVSVWTLDGELVKAFYGPTKYGGGGTLDPQDKNRFYYADEDRGTLALHLDWTKGAYQVASVIYRPGPGDLKAPGSAPETALYFNKQRYYTNCYNTSPTSGAGVAVLFQDRNGTARPIAAMGRANNWDLLKQDAFQASWPPGADLRGNIYDGNCKNQAFFIWTDANGDGQVEPNEVTFQQASIGGVTVMPDLSFCVARLNGKAVQFPPTGFSGTGLPHYDVAEEKLLAQDVKEPLSTGGEQVLVGENGDTVITLGIKPFDGLSLCGLKERKGLWSYPSLWPGLHASHEAAKPDRPGEVLGSTRLLGGFVTPRDSDAGALWAVNGNLGTFYLFTSDGLFVSTVFKDVREGKLWEMPSAERGMNLSGITLHDENFWPTISQAPDGNIYAVDGARGALVRLDGLQSIRRIPESPVNVSADDLQRVEEYLSENETKRQLQEGRMELKVVALSGMAADAKFDGWPEDAWVEIDKEGIAANFNSNSKPYHVLGAVAISDGFLHAGWKTNDPKLLQNSGEQPNALFKTGGALDLMIGTDPRADPKRTKAATGDLRLIVTQVDGKTKALLYRPFVPGVQVKDKVPFSSPWRTITFDQVQDISEKVALTSDGCGNYEITVPMDILQLVPQPGMKILGDIGILRGSGNQTIARVYWSNKATAIVSDVPSEAELTPALWGTWKFDSISK